MTDTSDINSDQASSPSTASSRKFGCWNVLAAVGAIVLAIAFFLPAQRGVREPGRRSQCKSYLKQIGLALHNYYDHYDAWPPAYTVDADGKPLHSWRTLLLPYLDQAPLYNMINFAKPWNAPENAHAYESRIPGYQCPSAIMPKTSTAYLAIVGNSCCFNPTQTRKFSEVTDGLSNTLAVIEVTPEQAVHWMSPLDAYEELVLAIEPHTKQSHTGGTHVLVANGAVRFLPGTTSASTRRALLTIAGGETIGDW